MKTVFVTGATGFLGIHLTRALLGRGYQVRAIHRKDNIPEDLIEKVSWCKADLSDLSQIQEQLKGVDAVLHAAGLVTYSDQAWPKLSTVNITGTADLVNLALEENVADFIYISTIATLNANDTGRATTEEDFGLEMEKLSLYGKSKMLGEQEVWRGAAEGLNAVIVNPSVIVGPGDWSGTSPRVFSQIWGGWKYYTEGSTGYVAVEDVVKKTLDLWEGKIFNERFVLNAENLSFEKYLSLVAKYLKKPAPTKKAGKTTAKWVARLDNVRHRIMGGRPFLSSQLVKSLFAKRSYSNQKVVEQLAEPFISIEKAVEETAEVFLSEHT